MPTSLFQYEMLPTTWFYLSSIMILATVFRFSRLFSTRNFDIVTLLVFTPGLLFISMGQAQTGYLWIHVAGLLFLCRLIADLFMVHRPLLDPNLTTSGVVFSIIMLIMFFVPNLLINRGEHVETARTIRLEQMLTTQTLGNLRKGKPDPVMENPGYRPFFMLSRKAEEILLPSNDIQDEIQTRLASSAIAQTAPIFFPGGNEPFSIGPISMKFSSRLGEDSAEETTAASHRPTVEDYNRTHSPVSDEGDARTPVLDEFFLFSFIFLAQFGVVWGLVAVGHCHFGNLKTGLAAAMIYLLLPYVNQMPGSLENIVPGMLLVLAVAIYRRPIFSGFLIGLAASLVFYPFFLIPLWIAFYMKRGLHRFLIGLVTAVLLMGILLMLAPSEYGSYPELLASMFGWHSFCLVTPTGLWATVPTYYRIPIIALYLAICFGFLLWPSQKNLAALVASSALLMLGVQFWMGNSGGLYMGWYLPLLILTYFRPNLEDHVAAVKVQEI
ncbi:MAG: hypothetical protein J6S40_05970 [Thermoguttaceae bacterium]|nr:hypothetical protein [Thermoguttaceae bacterium]